MIEDKGTSLRVEREATQGREGWARRGIGSTGPSTLAQPLSPGEGRALVGWGGGKIHFWRRPSGGAAIIETAQCTKAPKSVSSPDLRVSTAHLWPMSLKPL